MRASKRLVKSEKSKVKSQETREIHISGAEGLYHLPEIDGATRDYFTRAMTHPKGMPDRVLITIERVRQRPRVVPMLHISTVNCISCRDAVPIISELLSASGVSPRALKKGIGVVTAKRVMRGAALMSCASAIRMEPDRRRGVRVSRLGMDKDSERYLARKLARSGINTLTVREAVILASKVAACRDVVAELCISDDPDYTTGYISTRRLGYVRVPNIKKRGSPHGGRVFFVREGTDIAQIVRYLEETPVIVSL